MTVGGGGETGGEGIKEKEGKRRDRGGEGARAGMKCSAIKLSEPLTFSYKGAYLPWNGCLCSGLSHINAGLWMKTWPYIFKSAGSGGERGVGVN